MNHGLKGKTAIVVGGGGAIPGEIAGQLAAEGAPVAIWDLNLSAADGVADAIRSSGGRAIAIQCNAADRDSVSSALHSTLAELGTADILVNGAGGSRPECTTSDKPVFRDLSSAEIPKHQLEFFDIEPAAFQAILDLNYLSAVIPSQAVGRVFAEKKRGVILNISSIAGDRPLTRAIGYSNAKAAISSFTQWLAVHMAVTYSPEIRVNALAPGFVLTGQNRFLLVDERTGQPTDRGRAIMSHVPMRRYGEPGEIAATALFLVSDLASFVTGVVVPVDGGFTAFAGI